MRQAIMKSLYNIKRVNYARVSYKIFLFLLFRMKFSILLYLFEEKNATIVCAWCFSVVHFTNKKVFTKPHIQRKILPSHVVQNHRNNKQINHWNVRTSFVVKELQFIWLKISLFCIVGEFFIHRKFTPADPSTEDGETD